VSIPKSVEGIDLKDAWGGEANALVQQSVFCMNFGGGTDYFRDGHEWRGVRTETWQYTEWLDGSVELFNLAADPLEQNNLAGSVENAEIEAELRRQLRRHQEVRGDEMLCGSEYANWVDEHRRVIRNGFGELSHPESTPDWSLL
jgi:arylsulfatase A-like enzyme